MPGKLMPKCLKQLLVVGLGLAWPFVVVGQAWRSPSAIPIFRGTAAQGLADTKIAQSASCMGNLAQLRNSAIQFAADYNGHWPESWSQLTNYLGTPRDLYCPADSLHPPQDTWTGVDFAAVSYDLVTPGGHGADANAVFALCRVHGNLVPFGGPEQEAHPYDARFFPTTPEGEWAFPANTSAASRESAVSASCIRHLREIGLSAMLFAMDNQDILPGSLSDLTDSLASPGTLFCHAEGLTIVPPTFDEIDFGMVSYVMEAPGASEPPLQPYVRCRVHGHCLSTDGSVFAATNRYPPRLIVGHPLSQTLEPGQTGAFAVLTGDPTLEPLRFQWRRQEPFDALGDPLTNSLEIAGATNQTLLIPNARPEDAGYYDVIVWDAQGRYQLSAMAYLGVEPLSTILGDTTWETNACAANLRQIGAAARLAANDTRVLPTRLASLTQYLGWPVVLFCPSDGQRSPPASWTGVDFSDTSYVLCQGIPYDSNHQVLAACKVHGFQVLADAQTVVMTGTQSLAPHLDVSTVAPRSLVLTLQGVPGTECILETSTDLANWQPMATNLLATGILKVTNSFELGEGRKYYRGTVR